MRDVLSFILNFIGGTDKRFAAVCRYVGLRLFCFWVISEVLYHLAGVGDVIDRSTLPAWALWVGMARWIINDFVWPLYFIFIVATLAWLILCCFVGFFVWLLIPVGDAVGVLWRGARWTGRWGWWCFRWALYGVVAAVLLLIFPFIYPVAKVWEIWACKRSRQRLIRMGGNPA